MKAEESLTSVMKAEENTRPEQEGKQGGQRQGDWTRGKINNRLLID